MPKLPPSLRHSSAHRGVNEQQRKNNKIALNILISSLKSSKHCLCPLSLSLLLSHLMHSTDFDTAVRWNAERV